jgi:hypothetical protein
MNQKGERQPLTGHKSYGAVNSAKPAASKPAAQAPKPAAAGKQAVEAQPVRQEETSISDYFTISFWTGAAKNQVAQANGYNNIGPSHGNGK